MTEEQTKLVLEHRWFAWKLAARYVPHSDAHAIRDDLRSAAEDGLMAAAQRFDPSRGVSFVTFARFWIRWRLRHWNFRNKSVVRPEQTKRDPALRAMDFHAVSYDRAMSEAIEEVHLSMEIDFISAIDHSRDLARAVEALSERERHILHEHYVNETSLEGIAGMLGCSRERVRQLRNRALEKARDVVLSDAAE